MGRVSPFAVFHGQRNLEWVYVKNTPGWLLLQTLPAHVVYVAAACVHFARLGLLGPFLRAKIAAAAGLGRMLQKRSEVQHGKRVGGEAIAPLLESSWFAIKRREKRFDSGIAGSGR